MAFLTSCVLIAVLGSVSCNAAGGSLRSSKIVRHEGLEAGIVAPLLEPDATTPIHLMISAFQDGTRCAKTIANALQNAQHPLRLEFGVLQARGQDDIDCVEMFRKTHATETCNRLALAGKIQSDLSTCMSLLLDSIKSEVIALSEAEGPAHQRSLQAKLVKSSRPDKFCLQTDSHMDFLQDWDQSAISDWTKTGNEFAVLTAYPYDVDAKYSGYALSNTVDCCGWQWEDGIPRGRRCANIPRLNEPVLTVNWAAGMSFHRCHAEQNVPTDPSLEWIFTGEEVDRAARLWTSGYDMYLPTFNYVVHNYSHAHQDFWFHNAAGDIESKREKSKRKLAELLQLDDPRHSGAPGEYFPLGKQRTLAQYKSLIDPLMTSGGFCSVDKLPHIPVVDPFALQMSAKGLTEMAKRRSASA